MAKSDLSRDAIVERALDIADREGLDAITIRRLSKEFGVTPMALYWHVQNKDELLDAMGDRIFAAVELPADDEDVAWDVRLHEIVAALVRAFRAHPPCTDLVYRRIFACDEGRAVTERALRLLRRAGFSPRETADLATHALQTALMLVSADPSAEVAADPDALASKMDQKRAALALLPAEQFPYLREMADDLLHCDDVDGFYAFGIDLFVSGARAALQRHGDRISV